MTQFTDKLLCRMQTFCLLGKAEPKAICLIKDLNLTKSLPPLSCQRLSSDLSICYRRFMETALRKSGMSYLTPRGLSEPPVALPTNIISKLNYLIHKVYPTHHESQKLGIYGLSYLFLPSQNCATCLL